MVIPKVPDIYRQTKREALESLFWGTVTILIEREIVDPVTHLSTFGKSILVKDEPCRIPKQSSSVTTNNEPAVLKNVIEIRLKPELEVPAGATFVINYLGFTRTYRQSGEAEHYYDHQIIPLIVEELA